MTTLPNSTVAGSGAQPAPQGTVAASTLDEITRQVSVALNEFGTADAARKLARTDAEHAADAAIGEREKLLRRLAGVAHAAAWSEDDLGEAVKKAVATHAGNDKSKKSSLATFASEIKLACHRQVRGHVNDFFDTARDAWDDERTLAADDSEAPEPLRKAWSRMYHVVVQGMMRAAKDGNVIADADALVAFAERTLRERQIDYKRVKARLANITKELRAFHVDFPDDGIGFAIEYLGEIGDDDLKKARARVETPAPDGDDEPLDDIEDVKARDDADRAAPVTTEDLIDDALNDLHAQAA